MAALASLRSEILKIKRTASFYFTIVGAGIVPLLYLINVLSGDIDSTKTDPFNAMFKLGAQMNGLVFFPLYVVLICTLLPQIEFKNNTWKQLFASPQSKQQIFIAKFLTIQLLLILFLITNLVLMFLAAVIGHFAMPELDLLNQPLSIKAIIVNAANTYVCVFAICAVQFWLGLRSRNFIIPIAVGLVLWFVGIMMVLEYKSVFAKYYPYSYNIFAVTPKLKNQLNIVEWMSLAFGVGMGILGFLDFRRKKVTN
ncbi:MAG: hypothetical protein EOO04_08530 [Chitinophagaceae bacterium]|nr:MAG: hypothetical protein EOO04_08530 [Chitinophagaceae bacterium]